MKKIIVTGCNKGIGLGMVEHLFKSQQYQIIMGCRNTHLAEQARLQIQQNNPSHDISSIHILQVDLCDHLSIDSFVSQYQTEFGDLDILVNNGGYRNEFTDFNQKDTMTTINTNYYGTVYLTEKIKAIVNKGGKIVTIGSGAGCVQYLREDLKQKFRTLETKQQLDELADSFVQSVDKQECEQNGFPERVNGYGYSKLLINCYVKLLANDPSLQEVDVINVTPGYVKTDLAPNGTLTVEEGIVTPLKLIMQPFDNTKRGLLIRNDTIVDIMTD